MIVAGFLGRLLAKSMVETKGFLWAWLIQFSQGAFIFALIFLLPIAAGTQWTH